MIYSEVGGQPVTMELRAPGIVMSGFVTESTVFLEGRISGG